MSNVDKRIVEMSFDNKQFESGVDTSLSTIDRLKKALNFKDAEKSLDGLAAAGKAFSIGKIADNVQSIAHQFSALGIIGMTTLANLTTAAITAGTQWIESLTLKPARMGFQEYETQMNSIQTILANTSKDGTVLSNVVDALDILNEYSDKTIYNFTQMTRNIGTFTAAGVKLDTSVAAIKGIANLAAVSGSNADQASMAMYQLSQALASGTVKLQDWNSVVNAGMGGKVFQEALMETARVHGVAIDQMVKEEGSFRETLQKGWLTSEILTETLSKFTGDLTEQQLQAMGYTEDQIKEIIKMGQTANDAATKVKTITQLIDTLTEAQQSGWTKTWQIIVGDFNEAKDLMTELSGIFGGMIADAADARNKVLQTWKDLGGRTILVNTLRKALDGVLSIIKPIREAFEEIFPPITGVQLYNLSLGLYTLAKRLKMGEETAAKVKRVFKGFFAIFDIGRLALLALVKSLSGLEGPLGDSAKKLLDWMANGGDWIVKLRDQIKSTDAFGKALDKLKLFLQETGKKAKLFVDEFMKHFEGFKTFIGNTGENVKSFIAKVKEAFSSFGKVDTKGLTTFLDNLKERFKPLSGLGQLIFKIFSIAGKGLLIFQKLALKIFPFLVTIGSRAADGMSGFLDGIIKAVEGFDFNKFFDILNGGLLAALLLTIKKFIQNGGSFFSKIEESFGENGFLGKVTGIFDGVRESLEAYQKNLQSGMLLKIAAAIGILAISLVAISLIDSKKLAASLSAMTIMFLQLGVSLTVLDKLMSSSKLEDMGKLTIGLLGLATAILIMAGAVLILGKMKPDELGRGLTAVGLLMFTMASAALVLSKSSDKLIEISIGLVIFSGALLILVSAVERLAKLDFNQLTRGLIGIGVLCTELVLFMKTTDLNGLGLIKAVGILILAGALEILAFAVEKLANIDGDKLVRGLFAVGIILAEVALFVRSTSNATQVLTTAIALGIMAGAMLLMTESVSRLGNMSWEQIAKGLLAMAGALTIITIAAYLLPKDLMVTGASLAVVAGALWILAQALTSMGDMSWEEIGRGLTALGGSLLILAIGLRGMSGTLAGTAALALASLALLALAPALKMMGSMDITAIGGSLLLLAGIFLVFGVASMLLSESIPVILGLAAALAVMGLAVFLIGAGVAAVGAGIFLLALAATAAAAAGTAGITMLLYAITGIASLIPMIVTKLGEGILALLQVLVNGFPLILQAVEILLLGLIDIIAKVAPPFIETVLNLIDSLLVSLDKHMPSIVKAGYGFIVSLLIGIRDNIGKVDTLAVQIVINFLKAMEEKIPDLVDAGYSFIIAMIEGITDAVDKHMPELMVAITNLSLAIIKGLIKGWLDSSAAIRQGMWDICQVVIKAIQDALGIHSPSTIFTNFGVMTLLGFINGIQSKVASLLTLIATTISSLLLRFEEAKQRYINAGIGLLSSVISGVMSLRETILDRVRGIVEAGLSIINSRFEQFKNAGSKLINALASGAVAIKSRIQEVAGELIDSAKRRIEDGTSALFEIGKNVVEGLRNGIAENIYRAVEQAGSLASAVLDIIKSTLGISSPSDETEDVAMYTVLGMVKGFKKYGDLAYNSAKDLGKKTLSGLSETISQIAESVDSSLDTSPTIRPVLDLSDIQTGGSRLNSMFGSRTIDVSSSVSTGNSISSRVNSSDPGSTTTTETQPIVHQGDTFIQNNTSPKALTPAEVYRQTKNLLSVNKKKVGAP